LSKPRRRRKLSYKYFSKECNRSLASNKGYTNQILRIRDLLTGPILIQL